jgi:hypothetical protein
MTSKGISMDPPAEELRGSWTHSFEEDEACGVEVYRPTRSFEFPPARRGRETLDFRDAGEVVSGVPGPDDRQRSSRCSLTPLGINRFRLVGGMPRAPAPVIEIVEVRPDRLKLRFG